MNPEAEVLACGEAAVRMTQDAALAARLAGLERHIDAIWARACARRPQLYDAPVPHCLGLATVGGSTVLRAAAIRFRQLYAARRHPEWGLGLTPIGVSGATVTQDGRLVFARRAEFVSQYAGWWELAPSGHLCPTGQASDVLAHVPALLEELEQELGIGRGLVREVRTLGVVMDNREAVVDVCCLLRVALRADAVEAAMAGLGALREYDALAFPLLAEATSFAAAAAGLVPTSRALLGLLPPT